MVNRLKLWWERITRPEWPASRRVALPNLTAEERYNLMLSLATHPGWHYLMAKLENHKAACEAQSRSLSHNIKMTVDAEPLVRELIRVDEAIFWLGRIQDTVARAGAMPPLRSESAREGEYAQSL